MNKPSVLQRYLYLILLFLSLNLGCILMTFRVCNYHYQQSIVCLYGRFGLETDASAWLRSAGMPAEIQAYEVGLERLSASGYGPGILRRLRLIPTFFIVFTVFLFALMYLAALLLHHRTCRLWMADQQILDTVFSTSEPSVDPDPRLFFAESTKMAHQTAETVLLLNNRQLDLNLQSQRLNEMLQNIAHQMKTPLAGIQLYLEFLHETMPAGREMLTKCLASLEDLQQLVFRILRMARLDTDQVTLQLTRNSLRTLTEQAGAKILHMLQIRDLRLDLTDMPPIPVNCDTFWTTEAITNVLSNAAANTESGGVITCRLLPEGSWTILQIHNTGPVIPESDYGRIFERFIQLSAGQNGDGIGLHLAKTVMARQGGLLRIKAAADGNLFEFVFPEPLGGEKLPNCKATVRPPATEQL